MSILRVGHGYGTVLPSDNSKRFSSIISLTSDLARQCTIATNMHQQASDDSDANIRFKQAIQTSVGMSRDTLPTCPSYSTSKRFKQAFHLILRLSRNKRVIRRPRAIAG